VSKTVVIVGTLDTKGPEFLFLKQRIESHGLRTLVINTGILGEPHFPPDISVAEVARAAGADLSALVTQADRDASIAAMCTSVAVVAADNAGITSSPDTRRCPDATETSDSSCPLDCGRDIPHPDE
jgi:uncharacterized protein (UPF0261 family)